MLGSFVIYLLCTLGYYQFSVKLETPEVQIKMKKRIHSTFGVTPKADPWFLGSRSDPHLGVGSKKPDPELFKNASVTYLGLF